MTTTRPVMPPGSLPAPTFVAPSPGSSAPGFSSGAEPLDPVLVQQTKQELRQIVQEITQLSQSDLPAAQFYEEFLRRVVSALAAEGGAVWAEGDPGQLELRYQIQYPRAALLENPQGLKRHQALLQNVLQNGQATLVPPHSGSAREDEAGNPTDCLLILATLRDEQRVVGVVEIFQRAGGGPTTQRGYLRFLVQMTELASEYLKNRRLQKLGDRQALWDQLERFLANIHRGLDPRQTCYTIVNDSRPLLRCDRVTIALREGSRYRVWAVSGLDSLDRRATEIQLLGQLASVVAKVGKPLHYRHDSGNLPPQVEQPLQRYLDQSHARLVSVVPLRLPAAPDTAGTSDHRSRSTGAPLGVLICEQLSGDRAGDGFDDRVEAVARHSAQAIGNALEHHSLFLLPLWRALGRATWVLQARRLPKTILAAALVIAAVAALVLVPAEFSLAARGKLQPVIRRDVFAPLDGVVVEVPVRHEQLVAANQVLARLENHELELQVNALLGRRRTTEERIRTVQRAQLSERRLTVEERNRLDGELDEVREVLEGIDEELALLEIQREQLVVRSDLSGQVVTWNVQELLLRRPVETGQVLMTVVDPQSDWELELRMPEKRMGHLIEAARGATEGLPVSFLLASHPGREFTGRVVEIHRTAEVSGDEGNTVLLRVAINQAELPDLRSDTTVTAQVGCGPRALGYVWLHEIWETVHSRVLFWL